MKPIETRPTFQNLTASVSDAEGGDTENHARFLAEFIKKLQPSLSEIQGPLKQLFVQYGQDKDAAECLLSIWRSCGKLSKFMHQLIQLAMLETSQIQSRAQAVDLVAFLQIGVTSLKPTAHHHYLELNFESDLQTCVRALDPKLLESLLTQIFNHVFRTNPPWTSIHLGITCDGHGFPVIWILDQGSTFPGDLLLIFSKGTSGSGPKENLLAHPEWLLAKGFADLIGGRIELENAPIKRRHIKIHLKSPPLRENGARVSHYHGFKKAPDILVCDLMPSDPVYRLKSSKILKDQDPKATVLIIQSHARLRKNLMTLFSNKCEVLEAEDGQTGLNLAKERLPELIIVDVMLPGLDGLNLCEALKNDPKTFHLPILILTAKSSSELKLRCLHIGVDDYLIKPYHPTELRLRGENLIDIRRRLKKKYFALAMAPKAPDDARSDRDRFLESAKSIVESRLDDPDFGVFELAQELGYHRRQILRKFKSMTDQGPADFIRAIRLQRALQLLDIHQGNISQVAYACGFKNVSYFSKAFRTFFGQSPKHWLGSKGSTVPAESACGQASGAPLI